MISIMFKNYSNKIRSYNTVWTERWTSVIKQKAQRKAHIHKDVWEVLQGCTFQYTILELWIGTLKAVKLCSELLTCYVHTQRPVQAGADKTPAGRGGVGTKCYPWLKSCWQLKDVGRGEPVSFRTVALVGQPCSSERAHVQECTNRTSCLFLKNAPFCCLFLRVVF